jgi:hypothetical protein
VPDAKWVLNEVDSQKALRLRDDYGRQVLKPTFPFIIDLASLP